MDKQAWWLVPVEEALLGKGEVVSLGTMRPLPARNEEVNRTDREEERITSPTMPACGRREW